MSTCFPPRAPLAPGEPQGNLFLRGDRGHGLVFWGGNGGIWYKAELGSLAQEHAEASVTISGLACVGKNVLGFEWGNAQGTSIPLLGSPQCAVSGCRRLFCARRLAWGRWELCPDALAGVPGDIRLCVLLGRGHV